MELTQFHLLSGCAEGYARDATEIQNIQIAEGDVCHALSIPIYMVFPRLFTCPTLETTNFKVGKYMALFIHIYLYLFIFSRDRTKTLLQLQMQPMQCP